MTQKGANTLAVKFYMKGYKDLQKELKKLEKAPRTVLDRTLSDAKKRAPAWVAAEVAKQYGIKKKEVGDGKTSKIKVEGDSVEGVTLEYSGRPLTPTHFNMTPKAPPAGAYTLKAEIIKGEKKTLGKVKKLTKKQKAALAKNFRREGTRTSERSPIMLMPTGNKKLDGTSYIPFRRMSTDRKDIKAIKTISVPQMIDSERTAPNITKAINENLDKRLDHHLKQLDK